MPVSPAARQLNTSPHSLADLQAFARAEPTRATEYLGEVELRLRGAGSLAAADAIKALLGATGDLVERMAAAGDQLSSVFPRPDTSLGELQQKRAQTVGFETAPQALAGAQFVTGTVSVGPEGVKLTTDGGRELKLASSPRASAHFQMGFDMLEGFVGDGPISLYGSLGSDNQTFNVEAYALNTDGKFKDFTFGRINVDGDNVTVASSRGPVTILDPELKNVLKTMPRLAAIVPGAPVERDGKLVHEHKVDTLMGLARFKESPPPAANGPTVEMKANMADNHFVMKPLQFPAEHLARSNHSSRVWVRGWPELGADGEPSRFVASYVSQQLDRWSVRGGASANDADPIQAAVMQDVT
jgi:hypothetical protein